MRQEWGRNARKAARGVLRRFGVQRPEDIRVDAFAHAYGIEIESMRLDSMTAQLYRRGSRSVIWVSDREKDECALRFSLAHELGHFLLNHTIPLDTIHRAARRVVPPGERNVEVEANLFAAELLLPREMVAAYLHTTISLDPAWAIAARFNVSILAAARRFVERSSARCAAVFSIDGQIVWFEPSATFRGNLQHGQRLAPRSAAAAYFDGRTLADQPIDVPSDAWPDVWSANLVEHATASPEHRSVLSILWDRDVDSTSDQSVARR